MYTYKTRSDMTLSAMNMIIIFKSSFAGSTQSEWIFLAFSKNSISSNRFFFLRSEL